MIVGIIGGGAWGRALATLCAEAGHEPRIGYRGERPTGFPGTPNLGALARESDLLLLATPPGGVREAIRTAKPGPGNQVVLAGRGLEPRTGSWLSEVVLAESSCLRVGSLAGPALAAEVLRRRPSALVAASRFDAVSALTQDALHSPICRVYTSRDLRGVELAGAIVDVLAVAIGAADVLNLGVGVHGVVVTRGVAEATRLGRALQCDPATFAGLAGVGDLVACSNHRDHPGYQAGARLARGGGGEPATAEKAQAVLALARRAGVELPLTEAIAAIAAGQIKLRLALDMLMRREATKE